MPLPEGTHPGLSLGETACVSDKWKNPGHSWERSPNSLSEGRCPGLSPRSLSGLWLRGDILVFLWEKLLRSLFEGRSPGLYLREVTHISSEQRSLTLSLGQDTQIFDWKEMPILFPRDLYWERTGLCHVSFQGETPWSFLKEVTTFSEGIALVFFWEELPRFLSEEGTLGPVENGHLVLCLSNLNEKPWPPTSLWTKVLCLTDVLSLEEEGTWN